MRGERIGIGWAVLLGGGILIAACHREPASGSDAHQLPVARIGNHVVTVGDVERSLGEEIGRAHV